MPTRVDTGQRIRHLINVEPWLLAGNDDAPDPGRVLIIAGCAGCELRARLTLWAGRWSLEHDHGRPWTAHLIAIAPESELRPGFVRGRLPTADDTRVLAEPAPC